MKYFDAATLLEVVGQHDLETLLTLSTDSYSDEEVWKAIAKTGLVRELLCAAIQMAVVGAGNKAFGSFVVDGKPHDVHELFRKAGVRSDLVLTSKAEAGVLTPRRLMRLFRLHIAAYIEKHADIEPYLWRKYTKMSPAARHTTFPGAESFVSDNHQVGELVDAYKNLDAAQNTNVSVRINRVLRARKVRA